MEISGLILNSAMAAGYVSNGIGAGIIADMLLMLAVFCAALVAGRVAAITVMTCPLFILHTAVVAGYIFIRGWSWIAADMLLMLTVFHPAF